MLDLAVAGSATVLPDVLDFDRDREASPARMNRAMEYLYLRLAAATALQPEFESAIGELQAVGLDRLNEVLGPTFAEATSVAAQLDAIKVAFLTGQPLAQLLADLENRVTGRLTTVDAQLAANLTAVTAKLGAVDTKLAELPPTAKWGEATVAEARAATASRLVSAAVLWAMQAYVPLDDTTIVSPNLKAGSNFTWTIAGNRVLANPVSATAGQEWTVLVTQGGPGGFVLSFGSAYVPDDLATYPLLNAAAGSVTELRMRVTHDGKVRVSGGKPPAGSPAQVNGYQGAEGAFVQGSYPPISIMLGRTGKFAPESCVVYSNGQTPSAGLVLKITINGAQVGSATFDGNSKYATVSFTTLNFNKGDLVVLNPSLSGAYPAAAFGVTFAVAFN